MLKERAGLQELRGEGQEETDLSGLKPKVGILVADAVNRRLLEAASVHLELIPCELSLAEVEREAISDFELIIADEEDARAIRETLQRREEQIEGVNPAVIAVRTRVIPGLWFPRFSWMGVSRSLKAS